MPTESGATLEWVTTLLQTSDALFPTGSYAHSFGFEECVRLGIVHDENSLRDFLIEHAAPMLAAFELPYLRYARHAAYDNDLILLAELDAEVDASKLARETRAASAQLGGRRLKALRTILPEDRRLIRCECAVRDGSMTGHHVIICGVQAACAEVPLEAALGAYFYQAVAALASAALKLIRIGQEGVQRSLRAATVEASASVRHSLSVARDDAGWFDPLWELASMRHEHASERLFIS